MFFTFILPPIIFAAGYNLRGRSFFKYFLYILLFGVVGTIITFLVVAPLTYFANKHELFYFTFHDSSNINDIVLPISTNVNDTLLSSNNNHLLINTTEAIVHSVRTLIAANLTSNSETPQSYTGAKINFSLKEILLFASVISATDTVAALTFVKEESDPKLFSILFGEGVLNDAVCIVLYRILRDFTTSNEGINNI
jgi:hypothetical protein